MSHNERTRRTIRDAMIGTWGREGHPCITKQFAPAEEKKSTSVRSSACTHGSASHNISARVNAARVVTSTGPATWTTPGSVQQSRFSRVGAGVGNRLTTAGPP